MDLPVFSIQYFGDIAFYHYLSKYDKILIENAEYYVKQTLRNRTYILTANGVMPLIIPVVHHSGKEIIKEKEICYKERWQKIHYTAIVSAYKKAPYFEYYADELLNFLLQPGDKFLFQFNIRLIQKICDLLNIHTEIIFTNEYRNNYINDYRYISDKKYGLPECLEMPYIQVFSNKFPFQKNLSILDLIFNLGPQANDYISGNFKL